MAAILAGLRAFQDAERPARPPEKPVIARSGKTRLLDYGGSGPLAVFVPSLINPPAILDLMEDNSLLRWLSTQGVHPLLVDWGTPESDDRKCDLGGYVADVLQALLRDLGAPYHLVGYCLGGTMAIASAALQPPLSLTLLATPWDFSGFDEQSIDTLQTLWEAAQPTVDALGLLPLEVLQIAFWRLDTERTVAKYERFGRYKAQSREAQFFMAVEDWANSGPPLTQAAARELVDDLFTVNLPGSGRWQVGGKTIDPAQFRFPVRQIVSTVDRIVPAASALALGERLDLNLGHVGMIVSSQARTAVWRPLAQSLSQSHTSW